MKVAFFTYPSAFQNIGGGEIQLLKTKEYLEKEGAKIDLFDPWKGKIEDYDILHIFSSVKDCLGLVEVAKKRNAKVVISPVLWSDLRRALFTDGSFKMKADLTARHIAKVLLPMYPSARRKLLLAADLVFPNSEIEKEQIAKLFAIPRKKIEVVYNGVDREFADADPSLFRCPLSPAFPISQTTSLRAPALRSYPSRSQRISGRSAAVSLQRSPPSPRTLG